MEHKSHETYTKHLKKVVESRHHAEDTLKRAIASMHYVAFGEKDHKTATGHVERCKELVISGNIILKAITASEHIGDEHVEDLDEAFELFDEALEEASEVLALIELMKE